MESCGRDSWSIAAETPRVLWARLLESCGERDLLALPVRLGGLGLANPATLSSPSFQASELLTKPMVDLIQSQETNQTVDPETTSSITEL